MNKLLAALVCGIFMLTSSATFADDKKKRKIGGIKSKSYSQHYDNRGYRNSSSHYHHNRRGHSNNYHSSRYHNHYRYSGHRHSGHHYRPHHVHTRYCGHRYYSSYPDKYGYLLGGVVLGSVLADNHHRRYHHHDREVRVTRVVRNGSYARRDETHLFRDRYGNCFEVRYNRQGDEVREEIDSSYCEW